MRVPRVIPGGGSCLCVVVGGGALQARYIAPARRAGVYVDACVQELRGGCVLQCTRSQGIKEMLCDPTGCLEDVSVGAGGHGGGHALT